MNILVLYYSRSGKTCELAKLIATGIESEDVEAKLRTVSSIKNEHDNREHEIATLSDIEQCQGLALGSPTRFGMMASPLKLFLEECSSAWHKGSLEDKPACVFTSTSTIHGGQESTLLNMIIPLLHYGMSIVGVPYSITELSTTSRGGTPYGSSHVSGIYNQNEISNEERKICFALGKRLAKHAKALNNL